MDTIKTVMIENFRDSLYNPIISKYVDFTDIICMADGDTIEFDINCGKCDDGTIA